ncbi:MAG: GMC family oxidoreductase [Chitinophagales bacterium]|nr:GMC family oxidoreductase [Chitinophagales bacterium]
MTTKNAYDYIVIGSGFGGSVSAMRLSEKGYSVLVIEKGKRWQANDFPKSDWQLSKYLWMPFIKFFGIQKLTFFNQVFVISGVGVGGGSLVYANTHMMPKENFYTNKLWSHFKDWKSVLAPYFERAKFMLGTTQYKKDNAEDLVLKEVAEEMGYGHTFKSVDGVGVYLGPTNVETDPYFKGLGPQRKGCTECAACMIGCKHNAKNTLDKNYLWFAEKMFGAKVEAETLVTKIEHVNGEYVIHTQKSTSWFTKNKRVFRSKGLVVCGGVLGTMDLLLRQKHVLKTLPNLSDKLGENILTNSEMLSGVGLADRKLNHGIAISRIFSPDENTNIEVCKFPDGSGSMMRLGVPAVGDGSPIARTVKMIGQFIVQPLNTIRFFTTFRPATNGIIFLIMQTLENAMRLKLRKGIFGYSMTMVNDSNQRVPTYIPIGQEALYRYAKKVNGIPMNAFSEVMFNLASTAHILGGCPMGKTKEEGVVDDYFRAHGYPNMYILDGSIMPCNLGVNPSLTITTFAEYAMDNIPAKQGAIVKTLDKRMAEVA